MSDRAQRVFEQALTLDRGERPAFVDEACKGEPELREAVLALLKEAESADKFFDRLEAAVFSSPSPSDEQPLDTRADPEFHEGDSVGRYRIVSLIAYGGMGTVYRARDTRLDRDVALKFLPSHLTSEPGEQERLLAEARAAAAFDHPNVCRIHEVGETDDGRLFIAMPCYDGETLKERLRRGPLSTAEVVSIAAQIARGLSEAHARGIIHRDVKPGNVIVGRDGIVRLLDFGLAMAVDPGRMKSGTTPGTIAYMSPEQIRGKTLDARTDLWSLGVVLYQMLTGIHPFKGASDRETIHAILHEEPKPVSELSPGTTRTLAATVHGLLQKEPPNRLASASSLVATLEKEIPVGSRGTSRSSSLKRQAVITGGAVTLLLLIGVVVRSGFRDGTAFKWRTLRAQPSIAVLPLSNLSADSSDAVLATGMTEELIATLATADLRVMASTSVAGFKRGEIDVRQIADSLGVTNILEGGIQRIGPRLRVQVRLIDGKDGTTRWSQSYDREFGDLLTVQGEIVRAVAGELELRFDKDRQFVRHHTRNVRAYELYLRGWDPVLLRTQSGIWKAQSYFQQAIAVDSTYAAAHAGLALTYVRRARTASDPGMPVPQLLELADNESQKSITLDPSLAESHYALGRVREAMLDFPTARAALQRAIELDPNRSAYRRALSYLHSWFSRPDEELAEARRALETDPLNPYAITAVASALYGNRRYDQALAQLETLMAVKPPLQGVVFSVAQCYAKKGRWAEAIATLRPGAEAGEPLFTALLGNMLARTGHRDEADSILASLVARRERTGVGAFHVAVVHAGRGDLDQTFAWLDKSVDDRTISSWIMGPTFDDLHDDPRFQQLRGRLGLLKP